MFKNKQNIKNVDKQIGDLLRLYETVTSDAERTEVMEEIRNLTEVRETLKSSDVDGTNKGIWVSGAFSIASILLIMDYEREDAFTTKAFNIATDFLRKG